MTDNLSICQQLLDATGTRDYDTVRKLLDPAVTFRTPFGDGIGPEFVIQLNETFLTAMPDLEHRVTDTVAQGDTVAWELIFTGTHTGPLATPTGDVSPTGRAISFTSCDYVKLEAGRVVSWNIHMDAGQVFAALATA